MDQQLAEYLAMAATALSERRRNIFDLRLGLTDGRACTVEEVGGIFGLSRERIRQLMVKSIRLIHSRAKLRSARGVIDDPCVMLFEYLYVSVRPAEEGARERLWTLIE